MCIPICASEKHQALPDKNGQWGGEGVILLHMVHISISWSISYLRTFSFPYLHKFHWSKPTISYTKPCWDPHVLQTARSTRRAPPVSPVLAQLLRWPRSSEPQRWWRPSWSHLLPDQGNPLPHGVIQSSSKHSPKNGWTHPHFWIL